MSSKIFFIEIPQLEYLFKFYIKLANLNSLFNFQLITEDYFTKVTPVLIIGDDGGISDYLLWFSHNVFFILMLIIRILLQKLLQSLIKVINSRIQSLEKKFWKRKMNPLNKLNYHRLIMLIWILTILMT